MPTALVLTKVTSCTIYSRQIAFHILQSCCKGRINLASALAHGITCIYISAEDLSNFVTKFQWDTAKYPVKQSLRNLTEIISKVCMCIVSVTIMPLLWGRWWQFSCKLPDSGS